MRAAVSCRINSARESSLTGSSDSVTLALPNYHR